MLRRPLILACAALALGAAQAPAAGVVSSFRLTPDSTQAGANPGVRADLTFSYETGTDSVRRVTILLAPGLIASIANVPATCSEAQLRANACPLGSQIGSGIARTGATPRPATLYLMPPPTPADGAGFGTVVLDDRDVYVSTGTLDVVSGAGGQPVGEVKLGVPVVRGAQVTELHATMHATSADGRAFTRLPTSCAVASSSASVETEEGRTGDGADSFLPTGCQALGYGPALSSVQAIKDPSGSGVELIATLSQPNAMTESATKALQLRWPPSLVPDAAVAGACLTGTPCAIGTATAVSPLAPPSYLSSGTVALGGTPQAPTLTVAFPPPVPLSIVGAIDLANRTVAFPAVPDLPLSALTVDITGPAGAKVLTTTCAAGDLVATFTPQSGGATAASALPVAVRGCPGPKPPPPPLSISIGSRSSRVVDGRAKARLACSGGTPSSVCRGRLALTARTRLVRRVDGRRKLVQRRIALARVRYAVASGEAKRVALPLTDAGLRLLEGSRHRRRRVRATATLRGGAAAERAIVVRLPTSPASR